MNLFIKRGLIAGAVNSVIGFALSWFLHMVFPSIGMEYQNTAIFRPWTDPLMMIYFVYPFILGFSLVYLWSILVTNFKEKSPWEKAIQFAKTYFFAATIPGMFISLTSFQVSYLMIGSWTLSGFVQALVAGWVFTRVK